MALQNYFSNFTLAVQNAVSMITGVRKAYLQNTVTVTSGDNILSTYLLFKDVPWNARISSLLIENAAIASVNGALIGLYRSDTGAIIGSGNQLSAGADLTSAHTKLTALDGLSALTHEQTLQSLYEIAGDTQVAYGNKPNYDIVLQINAAAGGTGKVTARMELIPAG